MAKFRPVFTGLWVCDDKFQDYSPLGKLLFLYLITNEHTKESGIYKITPKTISHETDISKTDVIQLLKKELSNNVSYDEENQTVFIRKFLFKTGRFGRPDIVIKAITTDRESILTPLWEEFDKCYPYINQPLDKGNVTLGKGFFNYNSKYNNGIKYNDINKNLKGEKPEARNTNAPNPIDIELTQFLIDKILENDVRSSGVQKMTEENQRSWMDDCRKIREIDKRTPDEIKAIIEWCQKDNFWRANILSMASLRKQFDKLYLQAKRNSGKSDFSGIQEWLKEMSESNG